MDKKKNLRECTDRLKELEEQVAELAEVKRALQEAEDQYRILVENANDAIFVLQDGKIKFANPKALEIAGVLAEELEKTHYTEYLHPEEKDVIVERHEKRIKGKKILHMYPLRIVTRQGTVVWTEVNAVRIEWENQPATLNIIRDITSQKLMEQQYMQSESLETLRTLSGGLAHSFNNLLMGIQGRVSLLGMDSLENDRFRKHLNGIEACVREASDLTRQMLGFAQSGKFNVSRLNVNEIVDEVFLTFTRSQKEIVLKKETQPGLWPVEADRSQLEQALTNILLNACEAATEKGEIIIRTENFELTEARRRLQNMQAGEFIKLSVQDNGMGMEETVSKRAFEPFFTTKSIGSHRGLGLSSVYGIVANHNGVIDIESIPGSGTTVCIYLPASNIDGEQGCKIPRPSVC